MNAPHPIAGILVCLLPFAALIGFAYFKQWRHDWAFARAQSEGARAAAAGRKLRQSEEARFGTYNPLYEEMSDTWLLPFQVRSMEEARDLPAVIVKNGRAYHWWLYYPDERIVVFASRWEQRGYRQVEAVTA